MANTFTADFEEIWAAEQQRIFHKTNVALKVADTSFNKTMSRGDTLNRPYRSTPYVESYTRGSAITIQDLADTQQQLSVNREFVNGIYIDKFDDIQSKYNLAANYGRDNGIYLSNKVDSDVLGEVENATSDVDDGSLGGTTGNAITLTTSNILSVISLAKQKLAKQNVPLDNLFGVISPEFERILIEYGAGRDTAMGDKANENGFLMNFYGFKLYRSNQLAGTAVLGMATDPTAADTVVINGITFTAQTTIGTAAGNFLVGTNADTSRGVLTAFINDPSTTSSDQIALSASDAASIEGCTATNDNTANTMTVYYKGVGALIVSETLTAAADVWSTSTHAQHNVFGRVGAPTLVMQSTPTVQAKEVPDKLGKNYLNSELYGVKTFNDNAKQMVNVEIDASGFSA